MRGKESNMQLRNFIVLIPAYNPPEEVIYLVSTLVARDIPVVVVNDGSDITYAERFTFLAEFPKTSILSHAVNIGKGAALKYGLNYIYDTFPDAVGVVTADADGQHLPDDIERIGQELAAHPDELIIGARKFSHQNIPLRSKFGNIITRYLFLLIIGVSMPDTQSGLRGVPRLLIQRLLRIKAIGYEFELDTLITARNSRVHIANIPITTVYDRGNTTSHFNPLIDSMKIYFVLFRLLLTVLLATVIDFAIFAFLVKIGNSMIVSQICARVVALIIYYFAMNSMLYASALLNKKLLYKLTLLLCMSGFIAAVIIAILAQRFNVDVLVGKIWAETILLFLNYIMIRELACIIHNDFE